MPATDQKNVTEMHAAHWPRVVETILAAIGFAAFVIVALCVIFIAGTPYNPADPNGYVFTLPLWESLLIGVIIIVVVVAIPYLKKHFSRKSLIIAAAIIDIPLLILQILFVISICFETNWDPGWLVSYAESAALGQDITEYQTYLDAHPNNSVLAIYLTLLAHIAMGTGANLTVLASVIGAIFANLSGLLLFATSLYIFDSARTSFVAWGFYTVLCGFAIWMAVPYSDLYVIPFIMVALWASAVTWKTENSRWKVASVAIFSCAISLGALIKPTVLVGAIAYVLVGIVAFFARRASWARVVQCLVAFIVPCVLVLGPLSLAANSGLAFERDESKAIPWTHYLMMGVNQESYGRVNTADVNLTFNIEDPSAREATNLEIYSERMSEMGPIGYLEFLAKKTAMTYGDGTFHISGSQETQDFPLGEKYQFENPFGEASQAVRDVYYDHDSSMWEFDQILWLAMIVTMPFAFACFLLARSDSSRKMALFMILFFGGLFVFLMLFETRSRYLYGFLPLFCLLFSAGLKGLLELKALLIAKRAEKKDPKGIQSA